MTGKQLGEALAAVGVIASMVFVGLEVKGSNLQARAAAYQAIGVAASEFHWNFDDRLNRLYNEGRYAGAVTGWTLTEWEVMDRAFRAEFRLVETLLLQVEQRLLPRDAISRLGFDVAGWLRFPATVCLWPEIRVGDGVRELVERGTLPEDRAECPVDLTALRDSTILASQGR